VIRTSQSCNEPRNKEGKIDCIILYSLLRRMSAISFAPNCLILNLTKAFTKKGSLTHNYMLPNIYIMQEVLYESAIEKGVHRGYP